VIPASVFAEAMHQSDICYRLTIGQPLIEKHFATIKGLLVEG
jgi:hypothetical protein